MSYPASVGVAREGDVATEGLGWTLRRGATVLPNGVTFSVWAPKATSVSAHVATGDAAGDHPLLPSKTERGVWETSVAKVRAGDRYGYRIDGVEPLPDPVSRSQPDGVHALSEVVDPGAFVWTDDAWRGVALADFVIYEIHVGTFTAEGTFEAAAARLNELVALGITAIELMPVASFPGRRNWGYDGVHLYAPQLSLGPEGNYLDRFGPYCTDAYRTPWGRAMNYDGPGSDAVRRWAHDNVERGGVRPRFR